MKYFVLAAILFCAVSAKSLKVKNLKSFSWNTDCGPNDPIQIASLSLVPDPIVIPGTATLSVDVEASVGIDVGTSLEIVLEKYVDGSPVQIPCFDTLHLGSCTYDLCNLLEDLFGDASQPCPDNLVSHGVPCRCPMSAGSYNVVDLTFNLPYEVPQEIVTGDYHVYFSIYTETQELVCADIYASLLVQ